MSSLAKYAAKTGRELPHEAPMPAGERHVAAVAVRHEGKLLMGRRRDNNLWTNPGGHVEKGESPRAAAAREVKEEAGIHVDPADLVHLGSRKVKVEKGDLHVHGFRAELAGERPQPTAAGDPDREISEFRWVDTSRGLPPWMKGYLHVPLERNILRDELGHGKGAGALDKWRAKQ